MAPRRPAEVAPEPTQRFSVSIPSGLNRQVDELARKHRVSKSWIVREALERLLRDDMPLFHFRKP
jgi:metal-responsive CopG/Arc/MetJ family transcriptional regulator